MYPLAPVAALCLALCVTGALASEADTTCDLERAKVEVLAATTDAPYVYGSANNAPTDNGVTAGIGYSLSGRSKAKLMRQGADARCAMLAATIQLDEQQRWFLVNVAKAGAKAELASLLSARQLVASQLATLSAQLKSRTVTVTEYNAASQVQASIEGRIDDLKVLLSQPSQPTNVASMRGLIETARVNQVKAATLDAQVQAEGGWDVSAMVGGRKSFSSTTTQINPAKSVPYVGLTFRWSFGSSAADKAVRVIQDTTDKLFVLGQTGYVQTFDRLVTQVAETLEAEQGREASLTRQLQDTQALLATFKGLDTALAVNTKSTLTLQAAVMQAALAGARKRIEELQLLRQ